MIANGDRMDETLVEGGTVSGARSSGHTETGDLTREFPLLHISRNALSNIADKWTSVAPANYHEFERAWCSIRGREAERAKYLRTIGAERIRAGLLGNSITAQLLHQFITAFLHADSTDGILDILKTLTKIERFEIAVMLMTRPAKEDMAKLLEKISAGASGNSDMSALRAAFEL